MDAASSSGQRPGEGAPGRGLREQGKASAGKGGRRLGPDRPGDDDDPREGGGGGVPAAVSSRSSPRSAPDLRLAQPRGHRPLSPATPLLAGISGSLAVRLGAPRRWDPGGRGAGDSTRATRGRRRAGGRAERGHGSGTGPQAAPTYPEVRLEQCARHGQRASQGAEWSGGYGQARGGRRVAACGGAAQLESLRAAGRPPRVLNHARPHPPRTHSSSSAAAAAAAAAATAATATTSSASRSLVFSAHARARVEPRRVPQPAIWEPGIVPSCRKPSRIARNWSGRLAEFGSLPADVLTPPAIEFLPEKSWPGRMLDRGLGDLIGVWSRGLVSAPQSSRTDNASGHVRCKRFRES